MKISDIYAGLSFGLPTTGDRVANVAELRFRFDESRSRIDMVGEKDPRVAEVAQVRCGHPVLGGCRQK